MTVHARTIEGEIWICTRAIDLDLDRSIDRSMSRVGFFPGNPRERSMGPTLCVDDAVQRSRSWSARRRARMLSRGNASTAMRRMVLDNARHALRSMARR